MTVYVSDLFTATPAPVNASPASTRTWQWLRGSSAISGATSATYTAVTADIGSTLSATQLETNFLATTTATSAATEVVQAFDPIRLFSASEPGVWYDPTDMSTLFQNSTGTIPVTSFGQPVGLMLDKSRGLVLGPELVSNGDFSDGSTGWFVGGSWSIAAGSASFAGGTAGNLQTTILSLTLGTTYVVSFDVSSVSGTVVLRLGSGATNVATIPSGSTGRLTFRVAATSGTVFVVRADAGATITIDNISVKELPGLHATQSTEASRPLYGIVPVSGRRNLLLNTPFAGAVSGTPGTVPTSWSRVVSGGTVTAGANTLRVQTTAARDMFFQNPLTLTNVTYTYSVVADIATSLTINYYIGVASIPTGGAFISYVLDGVDVSGFTPTGTGTHTLGIRYSIGATAANVVNYIGSGVLGPVDGDITFREPQLEVSATRTPYQRVSTDLDVTEAGVASVGYLRFDGSTSWMVTPTITPGTDKVQVFAGVRKLSDAAVGIVAELSAAVTSNEGSFYLLAPRAVGIASYQFASRGTTSSIPSSPSTYPAPITNLFTGISDIAGDLATLRIDGTQVASSGSDQGTGNYLAYPLYIGRRGGTTLPFNGHLFPLIVRFGPNLTAARIAATEAWVATKTGGVTL